MTPVTRALLANKMYIHIFVISVVCLTPVQSTLNPLCIQRDIGYICYTIHEDAQPQKLAHEECRKTSGRLVTILDNTTQTFLDSHLNGSQKTSSSGYWLGATLEAADWTPINNQYPTYTLPLFQAVLCHIRGNLIIGLFQNRELNLFVKTLVHPVINLIRSNVKTLCLCTNSRSKCQQTDDRSKLPGFRKLSRVILSAVCPIVSRLLPDVLPDDEVRYFDFAFSENTKFIGVRTIRMMWDLGGSLMEENFSNWADKQPTVIGNSTEPLCLFASAGDLKWKIASCTESKAFVCENATTTVSTTSTTTNRTEKKKEKNDRIRNLVKLAIILIVIVIFCIIVGLLCNFRTKLLLFQQTFASMQAFFGSGSGSRRPWNYRAHEDESFYALVNDAHEMGDGYSAIGTAAETRRKELPPYAVVKKIPQPQPAGADDGERGTENITETTPAVHPKQPTENVVLAAAGGGGVVGYGSLQPCTYSIPSHEHGSAS